MREVRTGEVIYDDDGTLLLFTEDVAKLAGVDPATIRGYHAAARRARRQRRAAHFPPQAYDVRRTTIKSNGQPVTARTPVWRADTIANWNKNRLGPGGRPRSQLQQKQAS